MLVKNWGERMWRDRERERGLEVVVVVVVVDVVGVRILESDGTPWGGVYSMDEICEEEEVLSTWCWRKDKNLEAMICSLAVGLRPMLDLLISGLYQTLSLCLKNSLPASLTIRGYVTRPTQNQRESSFMVQYGVRVVGSMGEPVEKIRAISFAWPCDEMRVIVLSILMAVLLLLLLGKWKGFVAARE